MSFRNHATAVALALSLAAPVTARGVGDDLTTSVVVKRIAVHSPADARRLERRLGEAALAVCGAEGHELSEYRNAIRRSACYSDAMAAARANAGIADAKRSAIALEAPSAASGRP
ncbi:UrcA family protein [Sphingomonas abietis]|uniref:UrcA family protein n=1 Tax=Sphingomonas abietis TaxID=3012344 RepID=A0ABY7NHE5_9SPHN|nr:UrcA family protein [Sphingomonas abietis]WBO20748.1 UrcA family protein [Sphingomonas abietis]